jgi:hypothetical protein
MGRKILPESVTGLALKARAPRAAALERMALAGVESTLESMARICGKEVVLVQPLSFFSPTVGSSFSLSLALSLFGIVYMYL